LLDRTNFYAEQGGQEYDTGVLAIDGQAEFKVEDVQVFNGYVLHIGQMEEGEMKVGDEVICTYDEVSNLPSFDTLADIGQLRRWPIRNNHTGTHILNFALREVLGDHIEQKGSLVAPSKLRFDFSHNKSITVDELIKIEAICNDWIAKGVPVYAEDMPLTEAYKIPGLRAVFGEAYPDPVRVVSIGYPLEEIKQNVEDAKWRSTSIEFCGGT
jgi:alanyl-tRNA synthetase